MFHSTLQNHSFQKTCTGSAVFGFNGKEKDNEWNGTSGGALDFGARIYDSRLGRWMSVDPSSKKYPFESNYIFCKNTPTIILDNNGKDGVYYIEESPTGGKTLVVKVTYVTANMVSEETKAAVNSKMNASSDKKFYFEGEKVNVRFDIEIKTVSVVEYGEQKEKNSKQAYNEGMNTLLYTDCSFISENTQGGGNSEFVLIDKNYVNPYGDKPIDEAKVMAEEIGHNIGFLHSDGGIMVEKATGNESSNMTAYSLQRFINRLKDMDKSSGGNEYWNNNTSELDQDVNKAEAEKNSGITKKKK